MCRSRYIVYTALALLGILAWPVDVAAVPSEAVPAWAQDAAATVSYVGRAIQERQYTLHHEIFLAGEAMPSDALYKGYCAHVAYGYHFNDTWAWEAASLSYCQGLDTELKNQLLPIAAQVLPDLPPMPQVTGVAATHLQLKPVYGKQAWRRVGLVHGEAFLQAGPALVITRVRNQSTRAAVGVDFGIGLRLWLNQQISLRLDVGDLVYTVVGTHAQIVRVAAGVSVDLGGAP